MGESQALHLETRLVSRSLMRMRSAGGGIFWLKLTETFRAGEPGACRLPVVPGCWAGGRRVQVLEGLVSPQAGLSGRRSGEG